MALAIELTLCALWARSLLICLAALLFHLRRRPARGAGEGVAAVIPAFQEADQIGPTLAALGPAVQAIVVDDGSTDGTGARAGTALAGRKGAEVVRLGRNRGKAMALNAGLARVRTPLVLTLDADTRLAPGALTRAAALARTGVDAVALDLAVERPTTLLARLQAQEYAAALGWERAGQAALGIVSILPGAATLFRREGLPAFSGRTETEDADMTLTLAARGARLTLAPDARAETDAPATLAVLFRQRRRWTRGHLRCCAVHARSLLRPGVPGSLTTLNFAAGTLAPLLLQVAMIGLVIAGPGPVTGLGWRGAMAVAVAVVFLQRGLARALGHGRGGPLVFLLEPFAGALLGSLALYAALAELALARPARRTRARSS